MIISRGAGPMDGPEASLVYTGPSQRLIRLGLATALQGSRPGIRAPAAESSYDLEFLSPAVKCSTISDDILVGFFRLMGCNLVGQHQNCTTQYGYLSRAPWSGDFNNEYSASDWTTIPFANGSMSEAYTGLPIAEFYGCDGSFVSTSSSDGLRSAVAAWNPTNASGTLQTNRAQLNTTVAPAQQSNWTVVYCVLHNGTYDVEFSFHGQDQSIRLLSIQLDEVIQSLDAQVGVYADDDLVPSADQLSFWGYGAVMEVLGKILVGSVYNGTGGNMSPLVPRQRDTSAFQTNLAFTQELVQTYSTLSANASLDDPYGATHGPSLSDAIEDLFTN